MFKAFRSLLFVGMAMLATSGSGREEGRHWAGDASAVLGADEDGALSVMTYNIKGLPWPVALGRGEALEQIAARLQTMRRAGRQPHIVLLQEAFSSEAMALATRAGYRHAALGPDNAQSGAAAGRPADIAYLQEARWDRGEAIGKPLGSGLVILSDYPIARVDRLAFPDFACAGFDCLANKGVLIAHVDVPGMGPVSVINTHLNARKASGVSAARSQQAYDRQVELMARFITRHVSAHEMLILGGDMNIGRDRQRADAFFTAFAGSGLSFVAPELGGARQATGRMTAGGERRDLMRAVRHGKDWLFARDAAGSPMPVSGAEVPFGTEAAGEPLSDHVGYVVHYAKAPRRPLKAVHFASRDAMFSPAEAR